MLLGILVYGYATGVFSSRKLERATYDSVAFRFIAANDHPDHDTIAAFRRRFLKEIEGLFVQVLLLAREMGVLNVGTIGLDGTKIHANASRHNAQSYEHVGKIEAQLQAEVAEPDGQSRGGGHGGHSRWHVDSRRTGAARGAFAQDRLSTDEDRGARQGSIGSRRHSRRAFGQSFRGAGAGAPRRALVLRSHRARRGAMA
jgi:hypothetical protein